MKNKDSRRGSILIMMTLIMIVAAVYVTTALFDVRGTVDQERLYKTQKQMSYLQVAIQDYRIDNPSRQLSALSELLSQPSSMSSCFVQYSSTYTTVQYPQGWCGPYIDPSLFLGDTTAYQEDAWGTTISLSASSSSGVYTYTLQSCGENLTCGDSDDITLSF